jgi:hypothetical protein
MSFGAKDLIVALASGRIACGATEAQCPTASAVFVCGNTEAQCPTASAPGVAAPDSRHNLELLRREIVARSAS